MNQSPGSAVQSGQGGWYARGDDPIDADPLIAAGRTPDAELIRRMAEDDDLDAFAALFERYRVPVYRAALSVTGDACAAEEVLMDTFGRTYLHRRRLRTDVSPLPWLHRVALNLCYSRLGRRRLPSQPVTDLIAERLIDGGIQPESSAEWTELRMIVRQGIAALSEKHRAVVVLYYLEGRSLLETAEALDLPLGTVKSRIHHALRDLRARLSADHRFGGAWGDRVGEEAEAGGT